MRRMRSSSWYPSLVMAFGLLCSWQVNSESLAQSTMAEGWQGLPAVDFVNAAEAVLDGDEPPSFEHSQELTTHAWSHFLSDPAFIQDGDLDVVLKMLGMFRKNRPDSVTQKASDTLVAQINARLKEEPESLADMDLYVLGNATKALAGMGGTAAESAPVFVSWMERNDWHSLETQHLYNLFGFVNPDSLDRRKFSARWTGSLTAPQSGDYVFSQAQVYQGSDSQIKLSVDNQLILDTAQADSGAGGFMSKPIRLTRGQAVPFKCELIHDVEEIEYSVSAPMALITWHTDGTEEQIIASSAFTPPEGLDGFKDGSKGLLGEYFSDTAFGDLRVKRVDPTLDMIWSWPPTAPVETDASRKVFAEIVERLLDDAYLNRIATEGDEVVSIEFDRNLWRIAYRMSGSERLQLISTISRNPALLRRLSPEAIGRLYRGIYMLPGQSKLDLIGNWAQARPQPHCQAGWFPGWGSDSYEKLNTGFYWAIGFMLQGPYAVDAERLWDDYIARSDGECNLAVAYATAFAARYNQQEEEYFAMLKEHGNEAAPGGDQRVTWLIAEAFAHQAFSGTLQPMAGWSQLQEAFLTADSEAYRFWALEEMAARLSSLGKVEQVAELIESHRDQFTSPAHRDAIARWTAKAQELADRSADMEATAAQQAQEAYVAELQRRMKSGSAVEVARINQILESLPSSDTAEP